MSVKALKFLLDGATALGTIGTVAAVGDVVAKRTGVLSKDKTILGEATQFVLDVAGIPASLPSLGGKAATPNIGSASAPALPQASAATHAVQPDVTRTTVCPFCQDTRPFSISGPANVTLSNCTEHEQALAALSGYVTAMYDGWANHYGVANLGASVCGKKPIAPKQYNALSQANYLAQLASWQQCVDKEAQQAAQAKEIADAKKAGAGAQKKMSDALLANTKKKYDQKIADLQAQYAAEQDAQKQAQIQAQIDAANAGKAAAEKLAADLQAKATSDAQAKQLADLQAQILAAGQKSGGMDQLMQFMVMQQQMQMQQAQQAQMQQPQMMIPSQMQMDPLASSMNPGMMAVPWSPQPMTYEEPDFSQDMAFMGTPAAVSGTPATTSVTTPKPAPESTSNASEMVGSPIGNFLGIEGMSEEDADIAFGLVQSGEMSADDIREMLNGEGLDLGACSTGCSVR